MKEEVKVCIPTLNEEASVGHVVEGVIDQGYEPVVIDGGSDDETRSVARDKGAEVVMQQIDGGKGAAMKQVIEDEDMGEIVVFLDGDRTYETEHIDRLVEPIVKDDCDHVIGNRFADMKEGSMETSHRFGNRAINLVFRGFYGQNVADLLTGFRAINTSSFEDMNIKSTGFDIETELTAYSVNQDHEISVVGTSYYEREGESKLSGFKDGIKIANRLIKCRLNRIF